MTPLGVQGATKGLNENMEAAKENFLLKGYYNKKARAAEKRKKDEEEKLKEQEKVNKK